MDIRMSLRILGLKPGASQEEVKKVYRLKAKEHHPDIGGDAETFHQIAKAYGVLQNQGTSLGLQMTHKSIFEIVVE